MSPAATVLARAVSAFQRVRWPAAPKLPSLRGLGGRLARLRLPEVTLPEMKLPEVKLPDVRLPDVKLPEVKLPDVRLPRWRLPRLPLPRLALPRVHLPRRHRRTAAPGRATRARTAWLAVLAPAVTWTVAGVVLFGCYLHVARTVPISSDGASNVLQAWAMLHGNPMLRGWIVSDVSFYTTELPEYMLVEQVRGLGPDVVHVAAAVTYTVLVLTAAWVAKGRAKGGEGVLRALLAAGILIAPQQSSVSVLLVGPDHVGSAVPVLLLFGLIDRAGRKWYIPVAAWLLLSWTLVADQVVLISGVAPVAFVGLVRGYDRVIRQRKPARSAWFELALTTAALAAVPTAQEALKQIASRGGFVVWPVSNALAPFSELPHNLLQVIQGILVLFGANFPGEHVGVPAAIALLHLVGVGLVVAATVAGLRRFARCEAVVQLLAAGVVCSAVAYMLGPNAIQADSSREFVAVLPFGAALAGRLLAGRLLRARMAAALGVVLAGYLAGLVLVASMPAAPAPDLTLARWLEARGLDYGLADYWLANAVTVQSGGKVAVRAVSSGDYLWVDRWETDTRWYSPSEHLANFVVMPSNGSPWRMAPSAPGMLKAFGEPAEVYLLPHYTVLVWDSNLLASPALHLGQGPGG